MQILNACLLRTNAWAAHPITRMWQGYERALCRYGLVMCCEWRRRTYRDTLLDFFVDQYPIEELQNPKLPPWVGYEPLHASHRGRLLAKDPNHYSQFGWKDPPTASVVYYTPHLIYH